MAEAIWLSVFEQDLAQMPGRLDTLIGPKGVRLSGGQVQRVAAARMFIRQSDLLVMHDLSRALDVETEEQLWKRLGTCQTKPIWSFKIVVMKDGNIETEGKLAELLKASPEMQLLWEQQPA